jgi:RHS repeat-associated protein
MKLSKKVSIGTTEQYTQHYLGGIEYTGTGSTRKLEAIYFADGRVYNTNVTTTSSTVALRYEYAIRDHLGNTRLMFADLDGSSTISLNEVLQENHYYPFGMNMEGVWMNDAGSKDSKYLYNGKEMNEDFGLNWSDYGARWYDAAIGRWNTIDDLAEKSVFHSPYTYAYNNPMVFIDPNGMENITYIYLLSGSRLSATEKKDVIKLINQYYDHLGLKRIAQFIEGPIKTENFDKTDNLVVMGNTPREVLQFMQDNLYDMHCNDDKWNEWGDQSGGSNPEHSEDSADDEDVVGVSINGASHTASNMTKSTFGTRPVSKIEMLAFLAVHGTGHNAGSKHGYNSVGEDGFMLDGNIITEGYRNNAEWKSIRSFFSTKLHPNMLNPDDKKPSWLSKIGIIALMKKNLGASNTPVDNYSTRSKK